MGFKNYLRKIISENEDSFEPPKDVRDAAKKGLEWRQKASKTNKGGMTNKQASEEKIGSGVQRAVNLSNGDKISLETIKRMKAFFDRHESNKDVEEGKEPWEDRGRIAWELWGGDPGRRWANEIVSKYEKED